MSELPSTPFSQSVIHKDGLELMPVLFIGHGTPMNAVEDNVFSRAWAMLGKMIPSPKAILCVSAHWETYGVYATSSEYPATIHDFLGFPQPLYRQQYPAAGDPALAHQLKEQLMPMLVQGDEERGLDHGCWSFLVHMYPKAEIPVVQLSIDDNLTHAQHYELGRRLRSLRRQGVLVVGSGNMVHNLFLAKARRGDFNAEWGYDWALSLNGVLKERIAAAEHQDLINLREFSSYASLGAPSWEHYIPLLYALGLQEESDRVEFFNDKVVAGSISMTSLLIHSGKQVFR